VNRAFALPPRNRRWCNLKFKDVTGCWSHPEDDDRMYETEAEANPSTLITFISNTSPVLTGAQEIEMKKYSVRALGQPSWSEAATIAAARRDRKAARRLGMNNVVIVRNTDNKIVN
jgi:hypothetical protein